MNEMNPGNLTLRDLVTCPFNPSHVMRYSKFFNHFVKCKAQHPHDKRQSCPFKYTELIDPAHMAQHLLECPYRYNYGDSKKDAEGAANSRVPKIKAPYHIEFGDDYDRDSWYFDGNPDDIDSVSVIDEKYDHRPTEAFSGSSSCSSVTTLPKISNSVSKGKGRALFYKNMYAAIEAMEAERRQESEPTVYDDSFADSWLCAGNINGSNDVSSSTTSRASSTAPKSEFLDKLAADLKEYKMSEEFAKKDPGRGRGGGRGRGRASLMYR